MNCPCCGAESKEVTIGDTKFTIVTLNCLPSGSLIMPDTQQQVDALLQAEHYYNALQQLPKPKENFKF